MTRLRVLHVVCGGGFAGVERYVCTLAPVLVRAGHGVTVVGGDPEAMLRELAATGVAWLPGGSLPVAARSIARARRPDVIHAHMTEAELVAAAVGALRRVPVVSTQHFGAPRGSGPASRLAVAWADRRLAAQIAISSYVASRTGTSTGVVRSGVAPPSPPPRAEREPAVLVAQRLEAEKRTDVALRAWAAGAARTRGWRLWVVGAGREAEALAALARRLGVADTVDFLGYRSDVGELMRRASVLLATTPGEGLGLAVLEAMSTGLPVVATGSGGHLETVGGVPDAALFPPGDAATAARRVDELVADPERRHAYGDDLRRRQRDVFTVERQARELADVYREVVGR